MRPVLNEYEKFNLHKVEAFFDQSLKQLMEALIKEDVFLKGTILCVSTIRVSQENKSDLYSLEDRTFLTAHSLTRYVPTSIGGIIVDSIN